MQQRRPRVLSLRRAGKASLAAAAAWIGYSALVVRHHLPLPHALSAERREHVGRAGRLCYYVKGEGPPLLLLHSINAAASAAEVKPIFEHACMRYRVYAPDLPGFGFSDRSSRSYDIGLYVDAVLDMLQVIADDAGAVALDAAALSLSSEFLARAAVAQPERLRSLSLVNPTGFARGAQSLRASSGATREVPGLHGRSRFRSGARRCTTCSSASEASATSCGAPGGRRGSTKRWPSTTISAPTSPARTMRPTRS